MLYRSPFKTSAIALTTAAVVGLAFVPRDAAAQEITTKTDCRQYGFDKIEKGDGSGIGNRALCEIEKGKLLRQEGGSFMRQEKALDVKLRLQSDLDVCLKDLVAFKAANPDEFAKLGTVSRENACALSAKIPKPTASATKPSAG